MQTSRVRKGSEKSFEIEKHSSISRKYEECVISILDDGIMSLKIITKRAFNNPQLPSLVYD